MATVTIPKPSAGPDHLVLENVRWGTYLMLLKDIGRL